MLRLPGPIPYLSALFAAALPAQVEYAVLDLGALPGSNHSTATAMNERGDVVGWSTVGSTPRAYIYTDDGGMLDLGTLSGENHAAAYGINELRAVVGQSGTRSFRWSPGAGMTEILAGSWTRPNAINTRGEIAGTLNPDAVLSFTPFAFRPSTGLTALTPNQIGRANDINEAGQLVGYATARIGPGGAGAFRHSPTAGLVPLPVLSGWAAVPNGINERGDVVGLLRSSTRADAGFIYTDAGGMQQLPGSRSGVPADLNDHGVVVGSYYLSSGADNATIYTAATGSRDLNGLIAPGSNYSLLAARDINNAGQILVRGYDRVAAEFRALRLDPLRPTATTFPVGTGCAPTGAAPTLRSTPPALGTTLRIDLQGAPPATAGALLLSSGDPAVTALGQGCTAYAALRSAVALPVRTDAGGDATLALPLAVNPAWVGVRLMAQGALPAGSGLALTNGLFLIAGN